MNPDHALDQALKRIAKRAAGAFDILAPVAPAIHMTRPAQLGRSKTMLLFPVLLALIGAAAFWFTDLYSSSKVFSLVAPLIFVGATIAFLLWLAVFLHRRGVKQTFESMHDQ